MKLSRRGFLAGTGAGLASLAAFPRLSKADSELSGTPRYFFEPGEYKRIDSERRRFHLCAYYDEIFYAPTPGKELDKRVDPDYPIELPVIWKDAGVTDIWFTHYVQGSWFQDWDSFDKMADKVKSMGMTPHVVSVSFGHPSFKGPEGWKPSHYLSGDVLYGASCHAPADTDCVRYHRALVDHCGPCDIFMDDEFRCAQGPANIGGCICPECRDDFLKTTGFPAERWEALLDDLRASRNIPEVRLWIDYQCDRFSKIFRDTEELSPEADFGLMVMGMGSERAGIRLEDYRNKLLRVGEWMFTDAEYNPTKNKTIELFSSLFHTRFSIPGRLFSETSIIRPLSAENLTSKLSVATLSEVRNTMYFCPIPAEYWKLLAPRMKKEAFFHERILNQKARGPFKHFWGIDDRYMAGYDAFSLFLALGVPFEVCDTLPDDGWVFLGNASAEALESGGLEPTGAKLLARVASPSGRFTEIPESFEDLFALRRTLLDGFREKLVPYVEEETPVVLSEYPGSKTIYIWNIEPKEKTIHVRKGEETVALSLLPLDSAMVAVHPDGSLTEVKYES
ncbi:MAG: hypothetical protein IIZ25_06125 [Thermoguttaceae bacterium]|nr:hypothetical protein [Thermoguttaceae bacterium]